MKTFFKGLFAFIGAIIIFTITILIGILYSPFKAGHLSYTVKWYSGFVYLFKLYIVSILHFIGRVLYNIAIDYDILGNEFGEWIEDGLTYEEDTPFGVGKQNTISASIGWLIIYNKAHRKTIDIVNKILNKVFNQKAHAVDSWKFKEAHDIIEESHFEKLK